jgi:hypothetical protein
LAVPHLLLYFFFCCFVSIESCAMGSGNENIPGERKGKNWHAVVMYGVMIGVVCAWGFSQFKTTQANNRKAVAVTLRNKTFAALNDCPAHFNVRDV